MGRYLDAKVVDSVSENTHLPVTSAVLDGSAVPADFQRAVAVMSAETPFFISPVSETTIAGYVLVTDIEHKPVAVLRANMPRDIYQQGIASTNYTMASISALVAVFLVLVFVVLERLVLSRLARIGVDVGEIGESGDLKKRVRVQGEDEISRLGNAVNGMLTSLERSESQLRESEAKNRVILETIKEKTKQLEEAVSAAKASSQAKSEFLASMSHELRTPLNAIIGFSQVLHEQYFGSLNDKQAEYVADIVDSGRHLLSLINDILDLSKVEAGKMELEISGVKILDLLQNSLVMIKEKALAHSLNLEVQIAEDIQGLEIVADERRLKQVMFNLLSNATKFTPDGGAIKVEARKEGKELIISVSDTGIGMTPQEQKRLFEAFYQASGGLKDKTPGTGLGLAITKSIVEKHGGRIWLESEGSNKGSRFTFTLPI
jgi:signal transduction histidine kinase